MFLRCSNICSVIVEVGNEAGTTHNIIVHFQINQKLDKIGACPNVQVFCPKTWWGTKMGANQVAVTQVGNVWNLIKARVPAGVNIGETGPGRMLTKAWECRNLGQPSGHLGTRTRASTSETLQPPKKQSIIIFTAKIFPNSKHDPVVLNLYLINNIFIITYK